MKTLLISISLLLTFFTARGREFHERNSLVPPPADTVRSIISPVSPRQTIEGWGVSLCWWANMCGKWSDDKIDELVDWMVSPDGLNWNIFRYNIGGGDDPNWSNCKKHHMGEGKGLRAEMEGFQDERNGAFHWERDAAQRKILLKIKEKRPDAIFEAFSNSCPWWMTYSGCSAGNKDANKDNLRPEYYKDFANYLVEVCKHYKEEYGIEFRTLDPFNEPMTNYWYQSGSQEGCHFDFSSQVAFIKVLAPILAKSGLKTTISASDETDIKIAVQGFKEYQKENATGYVSQWNSHTYSANNRDRSRFGSLARAEGKVVWMSETGSGGNGIDGNLGLAQRLIDDVRYIAPDAWIDWQYMEENNDQWCLVNGSFANATYNKVKNFYVRQQVTRFIRQGYHIVYSSDSCSLAALNPDGNELVVVLINPDAYKVHHLYLPMACTTGNISAWRTSQTESLSPVHDFELKKNNAIDVTLPEKSITTLVIPVTLQANSTHDICDGGTYLIVPQSNATAAVSVTDNKLDLTKVDAADPAQRWTVKKQSDGSYKLMNDSGNIPTCSGQSALTSSNADGAGQTFQITKVDGIHVKICPDGTSRKAWEVKGGKIEAGMDIGTCDYGNSASADQCNWMLVRIKDARP